MTPTEKGRRADALNQGPDTRRVLCEMVANREADLEDARAENDRLREERDMYRDLVGMMDHPDLNAQLQAENAKLRECLQDLAEHIGRDDGFGPDRGWMLDRMRGLGVEVDW